MLAKVLAHLRSLQCEFSCWNQEESLDLILGNVDLLEGRYNEGGSLAGAVFGTGEDVAFCEGDGDGFFLDGRGFFETGFKDAHKKFAAEEHVLKFEAFGGGHIFGLWTEVFWWWSQTGFPGFVVSWSVKERGQTRNCSVVENGYVDEDEDEFGPV